MLSGFPGLRLALPRALDFVACRSDGPLERGEYFLSLLRGEIFLIKPFPSPLSIGKTLFHRRAAGTAPLRRSSCGNLETTCFSNCGQSPPEITATLTTPSRSCSSADISRSRADLLSASVPSRSNTISFFSLCFSF